MSIEGAVLATALANKLARIAWTVLAQQRNRHGPQEVHLYETYFDKLVAMCEALNFIRCHDFSTLRRRSSLDPNPSIEQLHSAAKRWWQQRRGTAEWRLIFQKTLGMIDLLRLTAIATA